MSEPFPDDATLDAIASRPAPQLDTLFPQRISEVGEWTMHGPGAQTLEQQPYAGDDVVGQAVAAVLAKDSQGRRSTAGMQCAAEQFGRFVLAHGEPPAADIVAFMAARCGTTVLDPSFVFRDGAAEELPHEAMTPETLREAAEGAFEHFPPGVDAAWWVGRNDQHSVNVHAWGQPEVELQPLLLHNGSTGHVDLRGRLAWEFENLQGYASRGPMGFSYCVPLHGSTARSPELELRCPVDPNDEMVVIELSATPPGRLLGRVVLRVIVFPREALPQTYRVPELRSPVAGDDHDQTAFVTGVNQLRRAAGLGAVTVAPAQTAVVESLLPHFLAALDAPDQQQLLDQIALGIIAGRRTGSIIRWGSFHASMIPASWTVSRELASDLLSPSRRAQLLEPSLSTIAYATLVDAEGKSRRSVLAGYAGFEDRDYSPEVAAFFDTVDRQRVARGLEPILRVEGPNDEAVLDAMAQRVRKGELDANAALDELLDHFVESTGRSFRGVLLAPFQLEGWYPELDGPLVTSPKVAAAVTISYFVPSGAAWGRHLVLVVYTEL